MSNAALSHQSPAGWPSVPEDVITTAVRRTLAALAEPVVQRLIDYYDVDGNFVGASFSDLAPNEHHEITAGDLHATSLMNVEIDARSTRRLLSGTERQRAVTELHALPHNGLAEADSATLEAMYDFYVAVKETLSNPHVANPNPWVTASKLCARKRPELFPVRDRVVCTYLGILGLKDVRRDWLVFRALAQHATIQRELAALPDAIREAAGDRTVIVENSHLRLLDAALWTYARERVAIPADTESK